ncbi:50S ribosomal protein L23 [Candidatus Dojkabacteria bacterium]|uniref:Large ribosomal subunit protein uL23 n=1 Tax=Candidatus Dojkabacteria bacterium TaxID=2099670 RepID=A0A955LAR8_9BACT|nr:50S ribosomal protein L23 [Candidatus Dojkabacteria bacterium]
MIILKRPIVTEKTTAEYESENKVTFEVALKANKIAAAKALEEVYGVKVEASWVINRLGKKKANRLTRKIERKSSDKKIIKFKLKKGDKIDLFKA